MSETTPTAAPGAPAGAAASALRPVPHPSCEPAFKPTQNYPDQLRPTPHAVHGQDGRATCCIVRGRPVVGLALHLTAGYIEVEFTPDHARVLAWQLMDGADQIDAGRAS